MRGMNATASAGLNALHRLMIAERPLSAPRIGEAIGHPVSRLRGILHQLKDAGILRASRGHGYVLARSPGDITLELLLRVLQSPEAPDAPCGGDYESCDSRASCILAHLCRKIHEAVLEAERSITLEDLRHMEPGVPNCIDPALRKAGARHEH
jgi:DNA-binding IscR family transcriptional regulator